MRTGFLAIAILAAGLAKANYELPRGAQVGGRMTPAGKPIQIDLPGAMHLHNKAGTNGAGLCVWTSLNMAAYWQSIEFLHHLRDEMTKVPGGGWPQRVDAVIKEKAAKKGVPVPRYVQVRTLDLEILKRACATGRMPCVTYCVSPTRRYNGGYISHMVNLVNADSQWFTVLDNNYEGETNYEHMTPDEFRRSHGCGGDAWSVIFLDHGPPPALVVR